MLLAIVSPLCFVAMDAVCVEELVDMDAVHIAPFLYLMPSSASEESCCVLKRGGSVPWESFITKARFIPSSGMWGILCEEQLFLKILESRVGHIFRGDQVIVEKVWDQIKFVKSPPKG